MDKFLLVICILSFLLLCYLVFFAWKNYHHHHPCGGNDGGGGEKFSHEPSSREVNFRSFPEVGYSSYANKEGIPYRAIDDSERMALQKREVPTSGYDIFGAGYGQEDLIPSTEGNVITDSLPKIEFKKENYINHHLNIDDSMPKEVTGGDFTTENEIKPPVKPKIYKNQNPMSKTCREGPNSSNLWPVSYEYPYRDPLYNITITGLYTAENSDPEKLKEIRYWPFVL